MKMPVSVTLHSENISALLKIVFLNAKKNFLNNWPMYVALGDP